MAKNCMFCGSELPDVAQFCPSCGKKQPEVQELQQKTKPQIQTEDEDSAELDLLSQFGFIQQPKKKEPPFKPTAVKNIPKPEPVIEQVKKEEIPSFEYKKDSAPEKKSEPVIEHKKEELHPKPVHVKESVNVKEMAKKESVVTVHEEEKVETSIVPEKTEKSTSRHHSRRNRTQETALPFQPTEKKEEINVNAMPTQNTSEAKYELPDDFKVTDEEETSLDDLIEMIDPEEEKRLREEQEKKEAEAIAAKRKTVVPKRKNFSESDDEEEQFDTVLSDKSTSNFEFSEGYADEIQDTKRRKEAKVEDDDDYIRPERRRHVEGRKNIQSKKRKKSSRNDDINKKIYNIEQDLSQLDPEEREYDGYYENVLPIDNGQIQKTKINPKIVLAVFAGIGLIAFAIYMIAHILGIV